MQKIINHSENTDLSIMSWVDYLAERLGIGDCVLLQGELGVGKTYFVRCLLRRLRDDEALIVPSPTFTILQVYEGSPPVYHYDLYRVGESDELYELGFEEAYGSAITLVEWPEILRRVSYLPPSYYCLSLRESATGERLGRLSYVS